MKNISLVHPMIEMEQKAVDFKNEFFAHGEKTINGSNRLDMDKYAYPAWVDLVSGLNQQEADLAGQFSHTFFAMTDDGALVGIVNFRHPLIGRFENTGHIGYSVRPSERRKGYATEILRQMLMHAESMALPVVCLVCAKDNEASQKTITRNRGKRCRTFEKNDITYEEYEIVLSFLTSGDGCAIS